MNPDRHLNSHWDYYLDLVKGDMDDVEQHRTLLRRVQRGDGPAGRVLPRHHPGSCSRSIACRTAPGKCAGKRVCPEDITNVALFTIEGELDDISGSGQTQAAHGLCKSIPKSKQQHLTAKGAGHYGIFSGRRWREQIAPQIRDFIRAHA